MKRGRTHIPERFLRQIWKHRQFQTSELLTTDDRAVEIFSSGEFNRDGGPDFLGALLRIGGILYRGDIELHQTDGEWARHFHNEDPKYNSVILHVVFSSVPSSAAPRCASDRAIPVLELQKYLTASHPARWNDMILRERDERIRAIRCFALNDRIDGDTIRQWIEKLAMERMELKIRRYEERLRELAEERRLSVREQTARYEQIRFGLNPDELPPPFSPLTQRDFSDIEIWRQLFFEGIMEALGYAKNKKPFLRLARNLTLAQIRRSINPDSPDSFSREALLFGVAGLLPKRGDLRDRKSKDYVRRLLHRWKALKAGYHREILHAAEWQFFRLRPENFPTLRIAGAARLIPKLLHNNYLTSIVSVVKESGIPVRKKYAMLEEMFIVPAGKFWSTHFRFGEDSAFTIRTLVGKNRAGDIILNALIPVFLLYARVFKDKIVREETLKLLRGSPAAAENAIIRQMEDQLIKEKIKIDSALLQQGMLRLQKHYCSHGLCHDCAVGRIVFRS